MHKSAMKCNETSGKWCKNKHGASKIIDIYVGDVSAPPLEEEDEKQRIDGPMKESVTNC
jgi:hypothetical protein